MLLGGCGGGGGKKKREATHRYKLLRKRREVSQFVNCQLLKNNQAVEAKPALFPLLSNFNATSTNDTSTSTLSSLQTTQITVLRAKRSNIGNTLRPNNQKIANNNLCKC